MLLVLFTLYTIKVKNKFQVKKGGGEEKESETSVVVLLIYTYL